VLPMLAPRKARRGVCLRRLRTLLTKAVDATALAGQPPTLRAVRTAARFFQHGESAENTVITEQKRLASTELHNVATKAIHQAWHVEVQ
jgi:hypothetical protein